MCKERKVTYSTQKEKIYTPETMIHDEEVVKYSVDVDREVKQSDK